eukprot:CAMPEP_0113621648 /NCGR_PEP_ID=MMETSP0017_2-20120614/11073_1 /TAXON_ID=2856 /ORGANISM="Cylindrotheca closterium" /LENGTH=112 /DNA_ID=CAMNT_0000531419 /DNA_START=510 /DNA_END=848 /DNA_ORIENTATION=- /assembly_acc=CAM_ASM_000147
MVSQSVPMWVQQWEYPNEPLLAEGLEHRSVYSTVKRMATQKVPRTEQQMALDWARATALLLVVVSEPVLALMLVVVSEQAWVLVLDGVWVWELDEEWGDVWVVVSDVVLDVV